MYSRIPVFFSALALAGVLAASPTIEQLAADPALWPTEVTVIAATRGTVMKGGKPAGMMLVGAGRKLTVTAVAIDGVTGKLGGDTVKVPADKTTLLGGVAPEPVAVATPAEASAPVTSGAPSRMQRQLSSKLVRLQGGKLGSVNTDTTLAGVKYYALYYSASWCGPCRQFTPQLVQAYRQLKQKYPQFELVFVSNDRSAGDMAGYMQHDAMPWPALKFDLTQKSELMRYAGPGIPCLVLVDAEGKVLADSFQGDNYLGPGHVLRETQKILAKGI